MNDVNYMDMAADSNNEVLSVSTIGLYKVKMHSANNITLTRTLIYIALEPCAPQSSKVDSVNVFVDGRRVVTLVRLCWMDQTAHPKWIRYPIHHHHR